MILLSQSINAWGSTDFAAVFKQEVSETPHASLPLQQGLTQSSYVSDEVFSAIILNSSTDDLHLYIKAGIFYTGIIAGCSCADDPTPLDTQNEYCELQFTIHRQSGETQVELLPS